METIGYLFGGESGYFGLFLLLVTVAGILLSVNAIATRFWDKYGDRISGMFRQRRL